MKKVIISFLCAILYITCLSQERQSNPLPHLSKIITQPITYAIGCVYDEQTEQWRELERDIVIDGFEKIEIRKLSYKESNYIILLKYYPDGYYEYPELKVGFRKTTSIEYFIIEEQEYNTKMNLDSNTGIMQMNAIRGTSINNDSYLIKQIARSINQKKSDNKNDNDLLVIQYKKISDKNLIRYLFFREEVFYSMYDKKKKKPSSSFYFSNKKIFEFDKYYKLLKNENIFNHIYYEGDLDNFKSVFVEGLK